MKPPILVFEKEGVLLPHKFRNIIKSDFDKLSWQDAQTPNMVDCINSFVVRLNEPPIRLEDLIEIKIPSTTHLTNTLASRKIFGELNVNSSWNLYSFARDLFYFTPQSDAIFCRQYHNINENESIYYQPTLVELNENINSIGQLPLVLQDKKYDLQVKLWLPKNFKVNSGRSREI